MTRDVAILKAAQWWQYEFSLLRPKMTEYIETPQGLKPNPIHRPTKEELEAFQQALFRYMFIQLRDHTPKAFDPETGWVVGLDLYVSEYPADFELFNNLWQSIHPGVRYETHGPLYAGTRILNVNDNWKVKVKNGRAAMWSELV